VLLRASPQIPDCAGKAALEGGCSDARAGDRGALSLS